MQFPSASVSATVRPPGLTTVRRRRPPRQRANDYPPNFWGKLLKGTDLAFDFMTLMEERFLVWNARVQPLPRLWAWTMIRVAQFLAWNARVRPLPRAWAWYRRRSGRTQAILAVLALSLVGFGVWWIGFRPRAEVFISVGHNMRVGSVSVWVDEHFVVESPLEGQQVSRRGALRTYKGDYSVRIRMEPGERIVRVRCASPEFTYDETREVRNVFPRGEERALDVTCDARNKLLRLDLR
jgi:hypothetical protein